MPIPRIRRMWRTVPSKRWIRRRHGYEKLPNMTVRVSTSRRWSVRLVVCSFPVAFPSVGVTVCGYADEDGDHSEDDQGVSDVHDAHHQLPWRSTSTFSGMSHSMVGYH